ncbi:MAG: cephalosporin hydroxylase family protein [Hyphomicrobiaceae bacterium]|jgi:cephalosporin hydroxylase|nr:cephalosporin hydroxylase family protein [Hyphomicrobiaceae bacterium]
MTSKEHSEFQNSRTQRIKGFGDDAPFQAASAQWRNLSLERQYVYNFSWLGRPIIQFPQDIQATQELIWDVKPDLIIETGIAHGGSLILSASLLALLDLCEGKDPSGGHRKVIGVDIDIRDHNRKAIEAHPMSRRIEMIQGSAIAPEIVAKVQAAAAGFGRVLVFLDSMHSHEHVLNELRAYGPMVSVGSYCVVFDTVIEDMPAGHFSDRPWDVGDNPKTAVHAWLREQPNFEIDAARHDQLMISVNPDGFLKRTS